VRAGGPGPLLSNKQLESQLNSLLTASQTMSVSYFDSSDPLRATAAPSYVRSIPSCGRRYERFLLSSISTGYDQGFGEEGALSIATTPIYRCKSSDLPLMRLATPEAVPGNGTVMEQVDVSSFRTLIANTRLGESGYAYAVDQNGRTIAHPNSAVYYPQGPRPATLSQVQQALDQLLDTFGRGHARSLS